MKGLIFTEFMEMVEKTWSLDMVDSIIEQSRIASGGVYTSVGSYPYEELSALINSLSAQTNMPVEDLIRTFGSYLFNSYANGYPRFFAGITDSFQFLSGIENIIHAEVGKLYPDTNLPTFKVETGDDQLILTYFSEHPLADLVCGLLEGCLKHFQQKAKIERMPTPNLPGAQARFILTRQA